MDEQAFDRTTTVCRSVRQMSSNLGQECPDVVVLDTETNFYFGLTSVAGHIWKLIEQPTSIGDLVDAVVAEYDVEADVCLKDTVSFVQELHKKGLVSIE